MVFFTKIGIKNIVRSREWRLKHRKEKFREFTTVADESLAMVVFENNVHCWIKKVEQQDEENPQDDGTWRYEKIDNNQDNQAEDNQAEDQETGPQEIKDTRPHYTDIVINNKTKKIRKGWSIEGIKRYNDIFDKVRQQRADTRYTKIEEEVMEYWRSTATKEGKSKRSDEDDAEEDDEEVVEARNDFFVNTAIHMV